MKGLLLLPLVLLIGCAEKDIPAEIRAMSKPPVQAQAKAEVDEPISVTKDGKEVNPKLEELRVQFDIASVPDEEVAAQHEKDIDCFQDAQAMMKGNAWVHNIKAGEINGECHYFLDSLPEEGVLTLQQVLEFTANHGEEQND